MTLTYCQYAKLVEGIQKLFWNLPDLGTAAKRPQIPKNRIKAWAGNPS